jgi:hypothetical protein
MPKINASQFRITINVENNFLTNFFIETYRKFSLDDYKAIDELIRENFEIKKNDKVWISKRKMKYNNNRNIKILTYN